MNKSECSVLNRDISPNRVVLLVPSVTIEILTTSSAPNMPLPKAALHLLGCGALGSGNWVEAQFVYIFSWVPRLMP